MSYQFDQDTQLQQVGEHQFKGTVSAGWNIGDNPNGGYLVSLVSAAIAESVPHPDPLSFTTHFLRPGVGGGECDIDVDVVRVGRTLSTVRARLTQEGKTRLEVMAAYGDLSTPAGVSADMTLEAPEMPEPERCIPRTGELQNIDIALVNKLDVMLHPELARPGESEVPEIAGWIRFPDGREPDARAMLLFCDTFPPSPFGVLGVVGWVPTIELTVHVRRRPAPGWVQTRFVTDDLNDGRMVETGCLWDSTGQLVAQSRQIGLVMRRD
ncbi:MAG: thioesterase family protein [Pseudomonadales bacterium]|nr:thioesterase family protein [Pseudomonadales bacterium]